MRRIKNKINFEIRALESDPNKGIKIKSYIDGLKKALSIIDGSKQWNSAVFIILLGTVSDLTLRAFVTTGWKSRR